MSETAKPKARTRAKPAETAAAPAVKSPAGRAVAPKADAAKPTAPRQRKDTVREDIRTQAIAAFTKAKGDAISHLNVRKIRGRREIHVAARVGGTPTQMRWSYADGSLTPLAA